MKKRKKRAKKGEPQRVTFAVTHIRLGETNAGKLTALDALAQVYLALTQQYVTLFCTDEFPDSFHAPCFETKLSERWQRVVIQQGAGIAKSWRTNRANAYQDYLDALAEYREQEADSNLGHIPEQIAWNATKRGGQATRVKSAYSSQQCHVCSYVDRKNRPNQQTFCCKVCGHTTHADLNASQNIATRLHDVELRACRDRSEVKALLMRRHEIWKQKCSLVVVQAPVQLGLWEIPQASTDVG